MKYFLAAACLALAACAHHKMTSEELDHQMEKMQEKSDKYEARQERQAAKMQAKVDRMMEKAN